MPQYANAKEAKWVVTKATALDDQGDTLSRSGAALDGFSVTLNAKELADTTPATYQGLAIAPVNGGSHPYVYDNGVTGYMHADRQPGRHRVGANRCVSVTSTGQLQNFFSLSESLPAGTYTVGFTLTDEGGLSTSYGTPGGQPMPGGPLQFTVTP